MQTINNGVTQLLTYIFIYVKLHCSQTIYLPLLLVSHHPLVLHDLLLHLESLGGHQNQLDQEFQLDPKFKHILLS